MVGLYKITSPSNKVYIGQSWDIERRWRDHHSPLRTRQPKLSNSFLKYGIKNHIFEILCELPNDIDKCVMDLYEHLYISRFNECGVELLNLTQGGGSFGKHSEESRKKLSEKLKGRIPWHKGKTNVYSDETRRKISQTLKGHPMAEKAKKAFSESRDGRYRIGKKHSIEAKEKISKTKKGNSKAWNKGIPWPPEVREKMPKFAKGHTPYNKGKEHKVHTEESRRKMSEAHKEHWKRRKEYGISISAKGEQSNSKLTEAIVLLIREKIKCGASTRVLSKEYNISQAAVSAIKLRKTWKHI